MALTQCRIHARLPRHPVTTLQLNCLLTSESSGANSGGAELEGIPPLLEQLDLEAKVTPAGYYTCDTDVHVNTG